MLVDEQLKTFGQSWLGSVPLGQRTHNFWMVHNETGINTRFLQKVSHELLTHEMKDFYSNNNNIILD